MHGHLNVKISVSVTTSNAPTISVLQNISDKTFPLI